MKKLLVAAALVGTTVGAQAADLAAKPYYKAPVLAQVYNWSGFYIGANAGVGFGRDYTQLGTAGGNPSSRLGAIGALGGGQIGYNLQYGNFLGLGNIVIGAEADIQAADLNDDRTCMYGCINGTGLAVGQKLDWFGTVRGRVGLATGPLLTYATGGFAYGDVKTTITDLAAPGQATGFSSTRTGWTVGSGVEAALGGAWTGRIEYLYMDLGTQSGANAGAPRPYLYSSEIREQIFRVGLNYRFGGNAVYVQEPVANWTGFFIGGNGGGATALNRTSLRLPGAADEKFNLSPDGYFGGGQIGYNFQAGNWVYGLETDFQGSSLQDSKACQLSCFPAAGTAAAFDQKMDWFGTVRGRVGYSIGSSLFYATGGFAYGDVKTRVFGGIAGAAFDQQFSQTKTGYAVGGGIESPFDFFGWFGKNWTTKTEYLFIDLGHTTDTVTGTNLTFSSHVQEQMLRTGLSYHFNGPVAARY
jgi:outer membrane immunogenic protein